MGLLSDFLNHLERKLIWEPMRRSQERKHIRKEAAEQEEAEG